MPPAWSPWETSAPWPSATTPPAPPTPCLPAGAAAWASALGTHDFLARTNYIHFTQDALQDLGPHVERLARLEGFGNHAASVTIRMG